MDSHRIGSDKLIDFQTDCLSVTIKGDPYHSQFSGLNEGDKPSSLKVVCDDKYDIQLAGDPGTVFSTCIGGVYAGEYHTEPLFSEQQQYEIVIEPAEGHTVSFWHENYNIRSKVTPVGKKGSMLSGILNFGNDIGFSDLEIRMDGHSYLKLTIEVFPSKISYKEDYEAIISDVTSEVYNLIFDFLKKTYQSFDISSSTASSPVEFFAIIRKIYYDFITAADMILNNPHHQLQKEYEVQPWYKIRQTDNRTIRWLEKHPENIKRVNGNMMAEKALSVRKYVTYDTKENRLTKFMLQNTEQRLRQFKTNYCQLRRETDEEVIRQIDLMINGIERRCNTGFMKEVNAIPGESGMSLVFTMAPGYRELYRCYLLLQHGLTVTGNIFNISVKDLAVLYEYWCFIKLNSLMKGKYELISQDVIQTNGSGLFVSLEKGRSSTVRYRDTKSGEKITLSYNPKETNVPTVTQRPDNVLRLEKKGASADYEYVFDAKYKINPAYPGTDYYSHISTKPGPEEQDINTMHRYRDAIVSSSDASPYERTMFGAYILFPYHNEEEYKQHRFYKSIEQVNIGGLPFLPSATTLVTDMLDDLIADSPESAFERTPLPKGIEARLAKVNWNKRDVLIGAVNSKEQMDICLNNNLYYVPASRIKDENMPIHYVALYQTKSAFGSEAKIEYYGEVVSLSQVKRNEIKELPEESDEPYYRLKVKRWKKLSRPIEPKERGFNTSFTNLFLLEHSSQVPELSLKSEEEYRLFVELKRHTDAMVINEDEETSGFTMGNALVYFEDGNIYVSDHNRIVDKCSVSDFTRTPSAVFRRICRFVDFLGEEQSQEQHNENS